MTELTLGAYDAIPELQLPLWLSAKSGTVPTHYRFRSNDDEGIPPLRPNTLHAQPEYIIDAA